MRRAALILAALSALSMPTALQAQDGPFTADTVTAAFKGFGAEFFSSECFSHARRPMQIAVAQMHESRKFSDAEEGIITDLIEEALAADRLFQVLPRRQQYDLDEIAKELGRSRSAAPADQLDGIIVIKQGVGRSVTVMAKAYKEGDQLCNGPARRIAVGAITEAPDVPSKFFDEAARKLPSKDIERVVVMTSDTSSFGNSIAARVLGQRLQEQLADGVKKVFQERAQRSVRGDGRPPVVPYADGMDLAGAWQGSLRLNRSPQGAIEVHVEFRSPSGQPYVDNGILSAELMPADSDPSVVAAAEAICGNVSQALDRETDPDVLQALARENLCPRLRDDLVKKEKFHRDRKEREGAIARMKSEASDLGSLADGSTVERQGVAGSTAVAWKFAMTAEDTVGIQLADLPAGVGADLRDSSWNIVATPRQSGPLLKEIAPDAARLPPGVYYIRIAAAAEGTRANYMVRVAKSAIDTAGDTTATARDLGALGPGTHPVREYIGGPDRGDVFKFTATERMRLQITVRDKTSEVRVELLDQSGQAVAPQQPGRAEWMVETGTAYYIAVTPGGAFTPYTLGITLSPPEAPRPEAPAASFSRRENAAAAAIGDTLTHSLTPGAEYWARFSVKDSSLVSIDLTWQDQQTDLYLYLFKEGQGFRGRSDIEKTTSQRITGALEPGAYFIRVKRNAAGSSPALPFKVNLRGAEMHTGIVSTPGIPGTPGAAGRPPVPGAPSTSSVSRPTGTGISNHSTKELAAGLVAGAGPVDYTLPANVKDYWGRFTVTERSKVDVILNWTDRKADFGMELVDDSGRRRGRSGTHTLTRTGIEPSPSLEPGSYLVHVYRIEGTGDARFTLTLPWTALPPTQSTSSQAPGGPPPGRR
jgi:hypothetical protein